MKKDKKDTEDIKDVDVDQSENSNEKQENALMQEMEDVKNSLDVKSKQCDEYLEKLQRMAAEFDNYKKRTLREKEALYDEAVADAVSAFLPVIDNLERALKASEKGDDTQKLKDGIELVFKQVKDVMKNLGVEEIKSVGDKFNPEIHNAVMHIEDESYGESSVIEEFQKGYIIKEKVIRHSMVKVAN